VAHSGLHHHLSETHSCVKNKKVRIHLRNVSSELNQHALSV
jgi:hypothetical protein